MFPRRQGVLLLLSVVFLLSPCNGQDAPSKIEAFSDEVADAMPEADFSSAEKVGDVLKALAREVDFHEIDAPGQVFGEGLAFMPHAA